MKIHYQEQCLKILCFQRGINCNSAIFVEPSCGVKFAVFLLYVSRMASWFFVFFAFSPRQAKSRKHDKLQLCRIFVLRLAQVSHHSYLNYLYNFLCIIQLLQRSQNWPLHRRILILKRLLWNHPDWNHKTSSLKSWCVF